MHKQSVLRALRSIVWTFLKSSPQSRGRNLCAITGSGLANASMPRASVTVMTFETDLRNNTILFCAQRACQEMLSNEGQYLTKATLLQIIILLSRYCYKSRIFVS